jgi:hypothetical protein
MTGLLARIDWLMIFRGLLTASLILLILMILYRQLIRKMKMRYSTERFAFLGDIEFDSDGIPVSVSLELPEDDEVNIEILDSKHTILFSIKEKKTEGTHRIKVNMSNSASGILTLRMTTSNHRAERKFSVNN